MRRPLALAALLVAFVPAAARADRHELYTLLGLEPQFASLTEPAAASTSNVRFVPAMHLTVLYGLGNSLHLGAALRVSMANDLRVDNANVLLPDRSPSAGAVYFNHRAIGLGALGYYRFDTGRAFAPALEAEVGLVSHDYTAVAHMPASSSYAVNYGSSSELRFHMQLTAIAEYRFGDHLYAAGGVGFSSEPGGLTPWQVVVPVRFGWIW